MKIDVLLAIECLFSDASIYLSLFPSFSHCFDVGSFYDFCLSRLYCYFIYYRLHWTSYDFNFNCYSSDEEGEANEGGNRNSEGVRIDGIQAGINHEQD